MRTTTAEKCGRCRAPVTRATIRSRYSDAPLCDRCGTVPVSASFDDGRYGPSRVGEPASLGRRMDAAAGRDLTHGGTVCPDVPHLPGACGAPVCEADDGGEDLYRSGAGRTETRTTTRPSGRSVPDDWQSLPYFAECRDFNDAASLFYLDQHPGEVRVETLTAPFTQGAR